MKKESLLSLVIVFLLLFSCADKNGYYRDIQLNRELEESRNFIDSETNKKYDSFDWKRAAIKAEKGDTRLLDYWEEKALVVKERTKELSNFLITEQNELLTADESFDSWEDLTNIKSLGNKRHANQVFLTQVDGKTRGEVIKDSIENYFSEMLELALTYKVGPQKYHFTYPQYASIDLSNANPDDTLWVSQLIAKHIETFKTNSLKEWADLQFKNASVLDGLNVFARLRNYIKMVELEITSFIHSKLDYNWGHSINAIEYRAIGEAKSIRVGEEMEVFINLIFKYEESKLDIKYGINDLDEKNWVSGSERFTVSGEQLGVNKVYGKIKTKERGELRWIPFEYEFEVIK